MTRGSEKEEDNKYTPATADGFSEHVLHALKDVTATKTVYFVGICASLFVRMENLCELLEIPAWP